MAVASMRIVSRYVAPGIAFHPAFKGEIDAAPLLQERHRAFVRLDDAREAAQFRDHVGQRGAFVDRHRAHRRAAVFEHEADRAARADRVHLQQMQHDVLRGDAVAQRAVDFDAQGLRHFAAHVARHPAIGDFRCARTECEAAERAGMRRVRIGAARNLPRQRVLLGHQRMTDAFGTRRVVERAVRAHRIVARERRVPFHQIGNARQQSVAHVRNALRGEHQVILERDDVIRRMQRRGLAERAMHQMRAHAGEVVVAEAPVGGDEHAVAALRAFNAGMKMALDDLLDQRLRLGWRLLRLPRLPSPAHAARASPRTCCTQASRRCE